jgi:hypothetical protein
VFEQRAIAQQHAGPRLRLGSAQCDFRADAGRLAGCNRDRRSRHGESIRYST